MLNDKEFDLWAEDYDRSVALSDGSGTYPFAGYRELLGEIYRRVLSGGAKDVLDIGFGTGTLTAKLYESGCSISGQDFSEKMVELARSKMPEAALYCGDFSRGLAEPLMRKRYDAIVATYSLHHLTDRQKTGFIKGLLPLLREGGQLYIGDVAFETRAALEACRSAAGERWDGDEIHFVFDELKRDFPKMTFEAFSSCAGLLTLTR